MSSFELDQQWSEHDVGTPEVQSTMAQLRIVVDRNMLTENQNAWSRSVQEHVLVSTYPLAFWMLQSWWRLLYEPRPDTSNPDIAWRMAHELGAAGNGFVWPKILFASDGEYVQIWASPSDAASGQSVRYLNGLPIPGSLPVLDFERRLCEFISTVLSRLDSVGVHDTELLALFSTVMEERRDRDSALYRKLEAVMGYDPDGCPDDVISHAIELCKSLGEATLFELAPVHSARFPQGPLDVVEELLHSDGINGSPSFGTGREPMRVATPSAPWELAVRDARRLREEIGKTTGALSNATLFDLLGIADSDVDAWAPTSHIEASVGIPFQRGTIKYLPRKRHHVSKRFEMARFIGDFIFAGPDQWLATTDVNTARQKYQRAFAAEFLCPINGLVEFLQNEFSEESIIDAAAHFMVSERTIASLLANNNYIERGLNTEVPYQLGFQYTNRR